MPSLKELIHEVHRRSLWQVLSVYVAGSWGTYQVVEMIVESTALPDWVQPLALVFLLMGLPIVVATAIVQEGVHLRHGDGDESREGASEPSSAASPSTDAGKYPREPAAKGKALLTWRNTLLGGLGAFALVGLISVAWLIRGYVAGDGPAVSSVGDMELTSDPAAIEAVASDSDNVSPATAETDEAEDQASDESDAGAGATVAVDNTPAPPPARPAGDRGRATFDAARSAAEGARNRAVALLAADVSPSLWGTAESEWSAGESAAASSRFTDAAAAMDRAAGGFAAVVADAESTWRARIRTARAGLAMARTAADPASSGYVSAMSLQDDAARLEGAGDFPAALDALTRAGDLYRSARAEAESAPAETTGPTPAEILSATFAELSRALASEDISAVRRVWTSLSAEQASNFQVFFDQYDDLRATYEPDMSTMISGDGQIRVTVRATWRYLDGNREREQPPFEQAFVLSEIGGRWVITVG